MADVTTYPIPALAAVEGLKLHHATRKKAEALHSCLVAEYPAITLSALVGEDDRGDLVVGNYYVHHADDPDAPFYENTKVPNLTDVLDACTDAGHDPEAGADEEEEPTSSGSVVTEHYRAIYREVSSTGQSCGDWLAEWLAVQTLDADGKLDVDAFVSILEANAVPLVGPWAAARFTQARGWQGRFRMNGRQLLEKQVAKNGFVTDASDSDHDVPETALAALRHKHRTWLAKEAKRAALLDAEAKEQAGV